MSKTNGLLLGGSLKAAGITFYQKQGQMIARSARSDERRSNTRGQFVQRQRMRHTTALWRMLRMAGPRFTGGKSAYARFATLANRLPAVYVPCRGPLCGASFLMPDMPVSDGSLAPMREWLGEVDGMAALLTSLKTNELGADEGLWLYEAEQCVEGQRPTVRFGRGREVEVAEMVEHDGGLALVGDEFGSDVKGWALVRVNGERCSTQSLVTRCTLYRQYTTEEALQEAARSYGGLTE